MNVRSTIKSILVVSVIKNLDCRYLHNTTYQSQYLSTQSQFIYFYEILEN